VKRFWKSLICLFRSDCPVFKGDAYTDWLRSQENASLRAEREMRSQRESGSLIAEAILGQGKSRGERG
jgi:hypothetical protein